MKSNISITRFLSIATVLSASVVCALSCLADPIILPVKSTPYDMQMDRIRPILRGGSAKTRPDISMTVVNHWIQNLRSMPYAFSPVWKTPAEVQNSDVGDCKGKAVALYEKMKMSGANNLRLVIGKRASSSRSTHAWLQWTTSEGTYILDPTINWAASKADRADNGSYIPYYEYSGTRKYRAVSSSLVAQN